MNYEEKNGILVPSATLEKGVATTQNGLAINEKAIATPQKYVTYENLEATINSIMAKNKDFNKQMMGGLDGQFPLTSAKKGGIYLLPSLNKYYRCIEAYSGSQISTPNGNFEDLSTLANSNRLDNYCKKYRYDYEDGITEIPNNHKNFSFAILGVYLPSYSNANKYFISNTGEHLVLRVIDTDIYHPLSIRSSYDKITVNNFSQKYSACIRWIEYYIFNLT